MQNGTQTSLDFAPVDCQDSRKHRPLEFFSLAARRSHCRALHLATPTRASACTHSEQASLERDFWQEEMAENTKVDGLTIAGKSNLSFFLWSLLPNKPPCSATPWQKSWPMQELRTHNKRQIQNAKTDQGFWPKAVNVDCDVRQLDRRQSCSEGTSTRLSSSSSAVSTAAALAAKTGQTQPCLCTLKAQLSLQKRCTSGQFVAWMRLFVTWPQLVVCFEHEAALETPSQAPQLRCACPRRLSFFLQNLCFLFALSSTDASARLTCFCVALSAFSKT